MHAHTRRLSLNSDDSPEKDLWLIFASIMTGPYLAVEIEEVKGVDAHLDFDLGRVHVLQGGIKTHHDASIILLPLTKKKNMQMDSAYSQIATFNLGTLLQRAL